jgi:hypothetical protein
MSVSHSVSNLLDRHFRGLQQMRGVPEFALQEHATKVRSRFLLKKTA